MRIASAVVLVPLALACLWYGGWAWEALVGLAAVGLTYEWAKLCGFMPLWRGWLYLALALAWAIGAPLLGIDARQLIELGAGALAVWLISRSLMLAAGVIYAGLGVLALLWLRADPVVGWGNVLFVLLIVWASDIGAYLTGRLIGGPKLAPAISPGKTWSGAAGGLVAAIAVGAVAAQSPALPVLALAAGLSVISQAGDLLESGLKRRFKVKDSSHLIPGHGGLFDRLDGLLAAAPAAGGLAVLLGRGVALWQW